MCAILEPMTDGRAGASIRAVRLRRGLRQQDVATAAGLSAPTVSRVERGRLEEVGLVAVRRVAATLDMRIDVVARWRGGELDRMLNRRHAALHEALAQRFAALTGWRLLPEVSFSIYGERGVVDALAWHASRRALIVIELKSEIVDVQGMLGAVDRYRRLAPVIAREQGLAPRTISTWVIVADGTSNRRAVSGHRLVLRSRYPMDGRAMREWLRDPTAEVAALSFCHTFITGTLGGFRWRHSASVGPGSARLVISRARKRRTEAHPTTSCRPIEANNLPSVHRTVVEEERRRQLTIRPQARCGPQRTRCLRRGRGGGGPRPRR